MLQIIGFLLIVLGNASALMPLLTPGMPDRPESLSRVAPLLLGGLILMCL